MICGRHQTARQETAMSTVSYDWDLLVNGLNQYLRLRSIPIGMKLFETVEEMEAIPKIRRPRARHTTDQIVAQARQLGWTVGITMADLVGAQCGAVIGLHPQDEEWRSGRRMAGVWFKTEEDAALHQGAMDVVPYGRYRAMAVSPLTSGRLDPPDVCLIYGTPGRSSLSATRTRARPHSSAPPGFSAPPSHQHPLRDRALREAAGGLALRSLA